MTKQGRQQLALQYVYAEDSRQKQEWRKEIQVKLFSFFCHLKDSFLTKFSLYEHSFGRFCFNNKQWCLLENSLFFVTFINSNLNLIVRTPDQHELRKTLYTDLTISVKIEKTRMPRREILIRLFTNDISQTSHAEKCSFSGCIFNNLKYYLLRQDIGLSIKTF